MYGKLSYAGQDMGILFFKPKPDTKLIDLESLLLDGWELDLYNSVLLKRRDK